MDIVKWNHVEGLRRTRIKTVMQRKIGRKVIDARSHFDDMVRNCIAEHVIPERYIDPKNPWFSYSAEPVPNGIIFTLYDHDDRGPGSSRRLMVGY